MNAEKSLSLLLTLVLALGFSAAGTVFATDYTVNATSECTLADAISAANSDQAVGNSAMQGGGIFSQDGNLTLSHDTLTATRSLTTA